MGEECACTDSSTVLYLSHAFSHISHDEMAKFQEGGYPKVLHSLFCRYPTITRVQDSLLLYNGVWSRWHDVTTCAQYNLILSMDFKCRVCIYHSPTHHSHSLPGLISCGLKIQYTHVYTCIYIYVRVGSEPGNKADCQYNHMCTCTCMCIDQNMRWNPQMNCSNYRTMYAHTASHQLDTCMVIFTDCCCLYCTDPARVLSGFPCQLCGWRLNASTGPCRGSAHAIVYLYTKYLQNCLA